MVDKLNLAVINFQDAIRSKPVRENFSDIEASLNDVIDELNNVSSAAADNEVVTARDYGFAVLADRLRKLETPLGDGIIDVSTIDDCNETSYISAGTNATAAAKDESNYIYGRASVKLGKSGTANAYFIYNIDTANQIFTNSKIIFWLYIADNTTLNTLLSSGTAVKVDLFNTGYAGYYYYEWTRAQLTCGWNKLTIDFNNGTSSGTIALTDTIIAASLNVYTNNAADTIASGNILIDNIYKFGSGLRAVASDTPDMKCRVLAGYGIVGGHGVYRSTAYTFGSSMTAPSANPRIDIVRLAQDGTLSIVTGSEAATPIPPAHDDNYYDIAWIYHRVGETEINTFDDSTNGYIIDKRDIPRRENWAHEISTEYKDNKLIELVNAYNEFIDRDYWENDSAVSTTSNSWVEAHASPFTFTPKYSGDYMIEWSYIQYLNASADNDEALSYISYKTDGSPSGVTLGIYNIIKYAASYSVTPKLSCSGFKKMSLTAGVEYTFFISHQIDASGPTSYIAYARMKAERILS